MAKAIRRMYLMVLKYHFNISLDDAGTIISYKPHLLEYWLFEITHYALIGPVDRKWLNGL